MLKGIAVSGGIGIGKVMLIEDQSLDYTPVKVSDIKEEKKRFNRALSEFGKKSEQLIQQLMESAGENEAAIIRGQSVMLRDPYLIGETEKLISDGKCAEQAFETVCDTFISIFSTAAEDIIKQRAADMRDIKAAMLRQLLGITEVRLNNIPSGTVIVARELTPSMTADINKENVAAIVTETGSTTSHTAILARVLEIPAVLSIPDITKILKNGNKVIVDGNSGEVIPEPDNIQMEVYTRRREKYIGEKRELESFRGQPTISASGERYSLFCNIGTPEDTFKAIDADGEGIGLFRSEFIFMNRNSAPSEQQQFEQYKKAVMMLKGKPLTIRTLDVGGDKALPYLGMPKEDNPFMGFRAIRYCLKKRDFFKDQLRAILRAGAYGNISVLLPMITCTDEVIAVRELIEECGKELDIRNTEYDRDIRVGVMIETPAAVAIADQLADEADFFSIGTNDLTGYMMACDRGNADVGYLYSSFQPAVLRAVERTIRCGKEKKIPVKMCGEAAADPMMIPLLISFGLNEFSVSPPSVLRVRKCISEWTKKNADNVTEKVMKLRTEREIVEYLKTVL